MSASRYFTNAFFFAFFIEIYSQAPDTLWTKTFGGSLSDIGYSVKQTNDGGFIIVGVTKSFGAGGEDIYLIRTDKNGDTFWTKTFGGQYNDFARAIQLTQDDGFIIAGHTESFGSGQLDIFLLKTDSLGNTEWFKTYGSSTSEWGTDVQQTFDGGYIVVGDSDWTSNCCTNSWAIRTDEEGNTLWTRSLSYPYSNVFTTKSVQQTADSGFVICANKRRPAHPAGYLHSIYIYKLDKDGNLLWQNNYERYGIDFAVSVIKLQDCNLLVAGNSGDQSGFYPWFIKLSSNGSFIWQRILNQVSFYITTTAIVQTDDAEFIATFKLHSGLPSAPDIFISKIKEIGTISWNKIIGGALDDQAFSIQQTSDSGYIIVGRTKSFGAGDYDVWLLRFDNKPGKQIEVVSPNGGEYWLMGDTAVINWTSVSVDSVKIQLSLNDGIDWITIEESTPSDTTYNWVVQAPTTSWYCRMKISDVNNITIYDISDTTFVIDMFPSVDDSLNSFISNKFALSQNYPNPFNPVTSIKYLVGSQQFVTLIVYDVLGNEIETLVNEEKLAGTYEVEFNTSSGTRDLVSGIYFYQLKAGNYIDTKKMILLK